MKRFALITVLLLCGCTYRADDARDAFYAAKRQCSDESIKYQSNANDTTHTFSMTCEVEK